MCFAEKGRVDANALPQAYQHLLGLENLGVICKGSDNVV